MKLAVLNHNEEQTRSLHCNKAMIKLGHNEEHF